INAFRRAVFGPKSRWITPEEQAALRGQLNLLKQSIVPSSIQEEISGMQQDPAGYLQSFKRPSPEQQNQVEQMLGGRKFSIPTVRGDVIHMLTGAMPIAFHGSPHKFEKFTTEKFGTGEGGGAYGWGLYFAENPQVAEAYKRQFSEEAPAIVKSG